MNLQFERGLALGNQRYGAKNYSPMVELVSPQEARRRFPRSMMSTKYMTMAAEAATKGKMLEIEYADSGGGETIVRMEMR